MQITPGKYKLRNGLTALVDHIDNGPFSFPVKGSILHEGKDPEYAIWTARGRFGMHGEHKHDLVKRIGDADNR